MLKQKVLEVLRNAQRPPYVTEVQRLAGIKQWHSARTILYKLVVKGLAKAEETDRETFFSIAELESKTRTSSFRRYYTRARKPDSQAKAGSNTKA